MESRIVLLQAVQEAYAHRTGLTIITTNTQGEMITDVSGVNTFSKLLFENLSTSFPDFEGRTLPSFTSVSSFSMIKSPIIYDLLPGLQVILAPVIVNEQVIYYLRAGVMLAKESRDLLLQYIDENLDNAAQFTLALSVMKDTHEEDKQALLNQIQEMSHMLSEYLSLEENDKEVEKKLNFTSQLTAVSHVEELLQEMTSISNFLEFLGIAKKVRDHYEIVHMNSEEAQSLLGHTFSIGEGFLGQAAVTERPHYWSGIDKDPRHLFFTQRDVILNRLFCIPLKTETELDTLLFGGSGSGQAYTRKETMFIESLSSFLQLYLQKQSFMMSKNSLLNRLTVLTEVCQMMVSMKDAKRILFILIDMSLNLVQGAFSCVVLKPNKDDEKVPVISRGLNQQEVDDYTSRVKNIYFLIENDTRLNRHIYRTPAGLSVIETPIVNHENKLYGILATAVPHDEQIDEYGPLLSSLAIMAGVSLNQTSKNESAPNDEQLVDTLHHARRQWDQAGYDLTEEANDLAHAFAEKIKLSNTQITMIRSTCLLTSYELDLLKQLKVSESLLKLIKNYQTFDHEKVLVTNREDEEVITILVLVFTYLNSGHEVEAINRLISINSGLREEFILFMTERQNGYQNENLKSAMNKTTMDNIGQEFKLTKREKEVLTLVIQGLNNREIAESLFISEHTIKNHITNIFQKLKVLDRSQAIAKVYQHGVHHH